MREESIQRMPVEMEKTLTSGFLSEAAGGTFLRFLSPELAAG